jgi:hypothetical protein
MTTVTMTVRLAASNGKFSLDAATLINDPRPFVVRTVPL